MPIAVAHPYDLKIVGAVQPTLGIAPKLVMRHQVLKQRMVLQAMLQARAVDDEIDNQPVFWPAWLGALNQGRKLPSWGTLQALHIAKVDLIPALAQPSLHDLAPVLAFGSGRATPIVD